MEIAFPKNTKELERLKNLTTAFKEEGTNLLEKDFSDYYEKNMLLITYFEDELRYGFLDVPKKAYLALADIDKELRSKWLK